MRIRTVICSPFLIDGSGGKDSRKIFFRHADARIGLSVLQKNIISWIVLLYQRIFQQQRIFFGINDRITDIPNLRNKHFGFETIHLGMEVRRNATLQVFCFTYIDNRSVSIIVLIAAGFLRHRTDNTFQPLETRLILFLCHGLCFT